MILFFTVALSAFMIFGVFTIGITYLDLSRLQNTRLFGAEYDATVINGFTEEQKTILTENPDIQICWSPVLCWICEKYRCRRYDQRRADLV